MDALDYGVLNVETYICYPSMCDQDFRVNLQKAILNTTCSRYFNQPCSITSISCGTWLVLG